MDDDAPRVRATERSFRLLEILREDPGATLSELAREVDLSKSAVYKHVRTLTRLGYLVREGDEYYLSNRFLGLGARARERLPLATVREVVADLAATAGHVSNFVARENDRGVYALCVDPSEGTTDAVAEGDVAPLHATAGGKAILACAPGPRRDRLLDGVDLSAHTEKTITDRGELERELRAVRDRRVAFDREEYVDGVQCVASPVVNGDGDPVGAVSVSGDVRHMSGKRLEEDVAGLVTSAAKSVENELLS